MCSHGWYLAHICSALAWALLGIRERGKCWGQTKPSTRAQSLTNCFSVSAEFSIWTREAGAGGLSIAVEGPSKAEITFDDHKNGSCGVSYIAQEPGRYSGANGGHYPCLGMVGCEE